MRRGQVAASLAEAGGGTGRTQGASGQLHTGILAQALHLTGSAIQRAKDRAACMERNAAAAQLLEAPGALEAAEQQLRQLCQRNRGMPPLTAQQLLGQCHYDAAAAASDLLAVSLNSAQLSLSLGSAGGLGAAAAEAVAQAMARGAGLQERVAGSTAALLRLDPGRVEGHLLAGQLASMPFFEHGRQGSIEHGLELARQRYEHGLELARQQRNDFKVALCGSRVVKLLLLMRDACNTEEGMGQVRAMCRALPPAAQVACARSQLPRRGCLTLQVRALLEEAQAAHRRCSKVLPDSWVQRVSGVESRLPCGKAAPATLSKQACLPASAAGARAAAACGGRAGCHGQAAAHAC